jgi:hypothetical protein
MSFSDLTSMSYYKYEISDLSASEPNLTKESHNFRNYICLKNQKLSLYSNKYLILSTDSHSSFSNRKSRNDKLNDIKKEIDELSEKNIQDLTLYLINLPINAELRVKLALDLSFTNFKNDNIFNQKIQQRINGTFSNENFQSDEKFEEVKYRHQCKKYDENDELHNRTQNPYLIKHFQQLSENDQLYNLLRKVKFILNRLTVQNFEKLSDEFLNLPIDDEATLRLIIDLIYEHAINQQLFSWIYARLCKVLADIKVTKDSESNKKIGFLELLLEKIQFEFETGFYHDEINYHKQFVPKIDQSKNEKINHTAEEKLEKVLGNVKFLGELFKLDLLNADNINIFIDYFLNDETNLKNLKCTCMLLKTVGKYINENKLNYYMDKLIKILNKNHVLKNSGLRFLIMDLIDLKKNDWAPRRTNKNQNSESSLS